MRVKTSVLIAVFATIFILSLVLAMIPGRAGGVAVIYKDGMEIERIELAALGRERYIYLDGNTVCVSPDGIRMTEADCPGCDCVRIGLVSRAGMPIVCLPNSVTVVLLAKGAPDAVLR